MAKNGAEPMGGIGRVPVVLFVVLVAVGASLSAVAWQESPKTAPRYTMVDSSGILQALLSSTVGEVSYTDTGGRTHVYTGWTVQELLVEDLELRSNTTMEANATGLGTGIEDAIGKNLNGLAGEHHYHLEASFAAAHFNVYDIDIKGSARANTQVHMRSMDANAKVSIALTE
jgi:hypothetical protein